MQAVEAASEEGEGEEAFTLGSVGHIFQFLQHNQLYAQQVRAWGSGSVHVSCVYMRRRVD